MSIKLYPPGARHGNRVWYFRVRFRGRTVEGSTGTTNSRLARRFAEERERELFERDRAQPTVGAMIEAYVAWRRPRRLDEGYLLKLRDVLGSRQEVGQADVDETSRLLYPGAAPDTWNRCVYTPLGAALRHAGRAVHWRRPKLKKPRHRAVGVEVREALLAAAGDPDLRALLAVLFFAGARISEAIALTWDRADLAGRRLRLDATKTGEDSWGPMHDRVLEALAALPRRDGRVFRWLTRSGPRKALAALSGRLGVKFHPHMARHSFATELVAAGVNIRDVMEAGRWRSLTAVARYIAPDGERLRKAVAKL